MAGGIDRARQDVTEGRLWKARERLSGVVRSEPHLQEALDLLGEVYFDMGDHPAAGRFWALTDRDDDRATSASAALEAETGSRIELLRSIPVREPLDAYPAQVQERIEALRGETGWPPRDENDAQWDDDESFPETVRDYAGCAIVGFLTVGIWLIGLVAFVWLVIDAL